MFLFLASSFLLSLLMSTENSLSLFFFFLSDSVSSGRSVVIENRQNVLSTKTNTALLMSPLERSARFVQASWRRRLCMLYPKRYKERQQQQQQPALSAVMSSPFVTVSVTSSKKSSVSSSGRVMEESGGGGVEMTNMDANTKVTTLCIGLSNMEITTMWKELGYPILRSMREQDNDLFDQARAAASAAAIAPGGESSERSEGSEGSSNSTTALTSGDDPAVTVAAASDASGGGGGGGEEGSPVSVLRCCRCCRCCCLLFLKCFQLHQLTFCF